MMKLLPRAERIEQPVTTLAGESLAELRAALEADARLVKVTSKAIAAPPRPARTWLEKWFKSFW
jgi:hypothetical protein